MIAPLVMNLHRTLFFGKIPYQHVFTGRCLMKSLMNKRLLKGVNDLLIYNTVVTQIRLYLPDITSSYVSY